MRSAPVSVSPSASIFNFACFFCELTHLLFIDGRREKEGYYKKFGREKEGDGRGHRGDGFEQALSKKETVA